ncbi:MAG: hypothetical protein ACK5MG_03550 [Bacteroidales bacterium]
MLNGEIWFVATIFAKNKDRQLMTLSDKTKFLLRNILQGLLWMAVMFTFVYLVLQWAESSSGGVKLPSWFDQHVNQPFYIYGVYILSEVFFGIIPPELFMIWSAGQGSLGFYVLNVAFLAGISYAAGYLAFVCGKYLNRVVFYRFIRKKYFIQYWPMVHRYGAFLILVAALTPLPFSGTSLLIGATGCPQSRYLLYALARFVRFAVYGFIVYQAFA